MEEVKQWMKKLVDLGKRSGRGERSEKKKQWKKKEIDLGGRG